MALAGARRVVGLDINTAPVEWARENARADHPEIAGILEFMGSELAEYPPAQFDYIVSKDTFEHVLHLTGLLKEIRRRLQPGGTLFAGYGPLWNSPFGDHGRTALHVPWAHVVLGETTIVGRLQRRGKDVRSIHDLGLNGMSLSDYLEAFRRSGMSPASLKVNCGDHVVYKLARVLAAIPPLREYLTFNVYCALRRSE